MKGNTKVLLIDDDITLGNILMPGLQKEGFEVEYMTSLHGLEEVVKDFCPNIIILDVEVGVENSINEMPYLKLCAPGTPVIFISSHTDEDLITEALGEGCVSYLKKPITIKELTAYIKRYANNKINKQEEICIGKFLLNIPNHTLSIDDKTVKQLSTLEYDLLHILLLHINNTVTRKEITSKLWSNSSSSNESLNNYIARLRSYLASDPGITLKTLHGFGFQLSIKK